MNWIPSADRSEAKGDNTEKDALKVSAKEQRKRKSSFFCSKTLFFFLEKTLDEADEVCDDFEAFDGDEGSEKRPLLCSVKTDKTEFKDYWKFPCPGWSCWPRIRPLLDRNPEILYFLLAEEES